MTIQSVGVIGAGTMGLGIAQVTAMAGFPTILYDVEETALEKAVNAITSNLDKGIEKGKIEQKLKEETLSRIQTVNTLDEVRADLVVEAIVENLEIKQKVFKQLEEVNSSETILATNTSSIPVTQIGKALSNPERLVGIHFFNPAHIMKLVEIISGESTNPKVVETASEFIIKTGKTPVRAADSPGFIVNRVARHFYVESLKILEERVASYDGIDRILESSGFRMGPFRLMDLIGVDTNLSVTESVYNGFNQDPKFRPSKIQQQKVAAGHNGRKSGKGFYDYNI